MVVVVRTKVKVREEEEEAAGGRRCRKRRRTETGTKVRAEANGGASGGKRRPKLVKVLFPHFVLKPYFSRRLLYSCSVVNL